MRLAFIAYWGIDQGLTQATVLPHLRVLSEDPRVEEIIFFTIERNGFVKSDSSIIKVHHFPVAEQSRIRGFSKFSALRKIYLKLKEFKPDFVLARSSLAGIPAYHYFKKTGTPYLIESFEPHAEYMIDAGEWKKSGFKYGLLKKYERKQMVTAAFLFPVSENYRNYLLAQGIERNRVRVLPCTVDGRQFARNQTEREGIRKKLKIHSSSTVGIYVGKFGGIYKTHEAFTHFMDVLERFDSYHLIVLTPQDSEEVLGYAKTAKFSLDNLSVLSVAINEVPSYLSASDIGFATYKQFASNKYLSPIKLGEYFASGLFVVCSPGVGDDASRLIPERIGVTTDRLDAFEELYRNFSSRSSVNYSVHYRSQKLIKECYNLFLTKV
ncbi:glycosyltransferase [Parvicella tangerina]|uniref:Glycosyltransferase subfamily 4-like N-terminal domain-containing protein n=1 Tax=Parvicella tangerina TaxID=2829795 RepID=A0A916JNX4_9FLAO|nr:glycosyltransferase [Parvicella tangerina]CAG5084287.1 hypothetical protein CRYO30217_02427 [Parvicella tangerina]